MILDGYYTCLRRLLATADPGACITMIGFGAGTAPEHETDTALTAPFIKQLTGFAADPDNPRLLRFSYRLLRGEAVGMRITEIGLLAADGTLVVRKVRQPIDKTADMEIGDTWEILV